MASQRILWILEGIKLSIKNWKSKKKMSILDWIYLSELSYTVFSTHWKVVLTYFHVLFHQLPGSHVSKYYFDKSCRTNPPILPLPFHLPLHWSWPTLKSVLISRHHILGVSRCKSSGKETPVIYLFVWRNLHHAGFLTSLVLATVPRVCSTLGVMCSTGPRVCLT